MKKVNFKYEVFNNNPYHVNGQKAKNGDCVIRAICKATKEDEERFKVRLT